MSGASSVLGGDEPEYDVSETLRQHILAGILHYL